jgi:pyruvate dehydrogenase E2 component (dihydrolipoamide acetyltransferase)
MSAFVMPSLGADMEDGTLVEQLIAPGEAVNRGDIIAVVETQKGAIEIEVFEDGFLEKWLVPVGTKVPVGTPIATILAGGAPEKPEVPQPAEPSPSAPPPEAPQPAEPEEVPPMPEVPPPAPSPPPTAPDEVSASARQRVTPAARRLAKLKGIDLAALGTSQIISLADLAGAPAPATEKAPAHDATDAAPLSAMRQAIAAAMARSNREIPHYYLSDVADLTAAEEFIATQNSDRPPDSRLLIGALFVRALARAAKAFPEFNGFFADDRFSPSQAVHVGMAINLRGGGLVAPALHDAAEGDLDALMTRLRDLVARVRQGRFRARELSDPTITLTSLGDRGVRQITGVIFPPQVAIVGFGTPDWQPLVLDGKVVARRAASVTLAADHRVSDGHRGARFLRAIITHLQDPEAL